MYIKSQVQRFAPKCLSSPIFCCFFFNIQCNTRGSPSLLYCHHYNFLFLKMSLMTRIWIELTSENSLSISTYFVEEVSRLLSFKKNPYKLVKPHVIHPSNPKISLLLYNIVYADSSQDIFFLLKNLPISNLCIIYIISY